MQTYDIIMLIVLAAAAGFGFWKGFAWQVASLGSVFLSFFIAVNFREPLAAKIDAAPPFNIFLSMLILFIGTGVVVWTVFRLVSSIIESMKLKHFDRQIGAMLGVLKGTLLCVIITLFAVTLMDQANQRTIVNSRSGYYIAILLDRSHAVMPPEVHDVLGPYIHSLDHAGDDRGMHFEHSHGPTNGGLPSFPLMNLPRQ